MNYYSTFFKALGISCFAVSIPSLFFYPSYPVNTTNSQSQEQLELSILPPISQANLSKDTAGKELKEEERNGNLSVEKMEEKMNENEFCPKDTNDERRNPQYCNILKEIIDSLEEIKTGFSQRVYLKLPTKENVSIPIRNILLNKDQNTLDTFNYYFKDNPLLKEKERKDFIYFLWRWLTARENEGRGRVGSKGTPEFHTQKLLAEIHKYFPDIRIGHYHKWRYMAIMERLAENGDDVILKPIHFYRYYHIFKDPWLWGLMVEEAKYFYFSGGSKWAGWKNKEYILNFTDALNTYIPRKKLN